MNTTLLELQLACEIAMFMSVVVMNVAKKNTALIGLYALQATALVILLSLQANQDLSFELLLMIVSMFIVKVIIAPRVFIRFVHRSHRNFSANMYLSIPFTLGVLILLAVFAQSSVFAPLFVTIPHALQPGLLVVGSILMSFFLIINRKGALSQIIGVLSLENSIFALGHFLNNKQSGSLEIGILFDVLFWIIISSTFVAMLYRHYKSLDVTELQELNR